MTKELSNVMLELLHIKMKPSNVRKKKGTIECDKKIVKCNVEIRGVHQTAKTTPKSPAKWHNRTALQITAHHTAWCNVVCCFIIRKPHKLHRTTSSLYINIFIYF